MATPMVVDELDLRSLLLRRYHRGWTCMLRLVAASTPCRKTAGGFHAGKISSPKRAPPPADDRAKTDSFEPAPYRGPDLLIDARRVQARLLELHIGYRFPDDVIDQIDANGREGGDRAYRRTQALLTPPDARPAPNTTSANVRCDVALGVADSLCG